MQPSQSNVPTPTRNRRTRHLVLIVLLMLMLGTVGIIVFLLLRTSYIQNNYTKLGSNLVTFSVNPQQISPGKSFSLTANFKKAYNFGNYGWYSNLSIINSAGDDTLLTPSELLTSVGYVPRNPDRTSFNTAITSAAAVIDSRSGLFPETTYAQLQKRRNDPNSFYTEDIGCGLGLGPPTEPPKKYTDTLTFVVLPQTPPGDYTVIVRPGTYCNGLPVSTESLHITVLPTK